jgi:hypothetical protein
MMTPLSIRGARAWGLLALTLVLVVAASGPAAAQVNVQLSGTIESIDGQTLTLLTNPPPRRTMTGLTLTLAPAPPPTLVVDLTEVPASQYVFLRPGERIAVVGLPSADGRRFAAIAIIGGAGPPRHPQAP